MRSSRMINGIDVQFPFETPYPAQIMVASKILTALQKQQNALVESPTGTGKSLALLCSVLAYQKSLESISDDGFIERKIPTVYYMSRTHSQLAQVVQELSRTVYRPKMTILGSREQLCIRKRNGMSADDNCHNLLNEGSCEYYYNTYRLRSALERSEVYDIEDLVKSGTSLKACPYFTTRSLSRPPGQAKLIFCPYNYVVDMAIRRSLGLDLKNAILIFDEAHNIENVAREAASSTFEIPFLESALNSLHDVQDSSCLRSALRGLIAYISRCADSMTTISFEHDAHVESGQRMLDILSDFGLGSDSLESLRSTIQMLSAKYRDDPEETENEDNEMTSGTSRQRGLAVDGIDTNKVMAALRLCETLCSTLELLYKDGATQHYRLALTRKSSVIASAWEYSVSFWCLSPSVAIESIAKDAASIIVASGTLFPLGSFAAELGICFDQKVEAPHVISKDQIWVGVVPDVCNRHLTSTYNFASTLEFQDQLALTLTSLSSRIPAGMLVFLPSYSLLDRLITRWKQTRQFSELNRIKTIFIEDRKSGSSFDSKIKKYRRQCNSKKGAVFFGVYRGKLSEGIDFANHDARAVVCVGIPYPNTKEAQVALKQAHNTALLRSDPKNPIPSGRAWYSQQAYRALNQSVGRCIRHNRDYGAIIFIDSRFQQSDVFSNISKWVRREFVVYQSFNEASAKLDDFFLKMTERYPLVTEPEWKQGTSKPGVHIGALDSFVKKWAVNKKSQLSNSSSDNNEHMLDGHDVDSSTVQIWKNTNAKECYNLDDAERKKTTFRNDQPVKIVTSLADSISTTTAASVHETSSSSALSDSINLASLDKFSYKNAANSNLVCDVTVKAADSAFDSSFVCDLTNIAADPASDTISAISTSFTKTISYTQQVFKCRTCRSVMWENPGDYQIRKARRESRLALSLFSPSAISSIQPMEGFNDIHVIYDFPQPVPSSIKADNNSLIFSSELGVVLRKLFCQKCNADLGGEIVACNSSNLLLSALGHSWILGAVIDVGFANGTASAVQPAPSLPFSSSSNNNPLVLPANFLESENSNCINSMSLDKIELKESISVKKEPVLQESQLTDAHQNQKFERKESFSVKKEQVRQESLLRDAQQNHLHNSWHHPGSTFAQSMNYQMDESSSITQYCDTRNVGQENTNLSSPNVASSLKKPSLQDFRPKLQPAAWLPCKKGRFVKH